LSISDHEILSDLVLFTGNRLLKLVQLPLNLNCGSSFTSVAGELSTYLFCIPTREKKDVWITDATDKRISPICSLSLINFVIRVIFPIHDSDIQHQSVKGHAFTAKVQQQANFKTVGL